MNTGRIARVNELLRREIAEAFYRIFGEQEFDLSAVTVTHVDTSPDLRHARVGLSIRGDESTQQATMRRVRQQRKEFQRIIGRNVVLKYNPQLKFEIDRSLQEGDRVLDLIRELEERETPPAGDADRSEEAEPPPAPS